MIAIAGGMIRSGSTFAFNVLREALLVDGTVEVASSNSIPEAAYLRSNREHFILKSHAPDEAVLEKIRRRVLPCVCTIRNPVDAISSWMHTFDLPIESGIESVRTWLTWYTSVKTEVLTIQFDEIEMDPLSAIDRIVRYIGVSLAPQFAAALAEKYSKVALKRQYDALERTEGAVDLGFSYYDPVTFFHRRHISNPEAGHAGGELRPDQTSRIQTELRDFLERDDLSALLAR